MRHALTFVLALTLAVTLWLAAPPHADAFTPRPIYPASPTSYNPQHMPGWDWWKTYPWSPYNYGRNPYNPIILPYTYPYYGYPYSYPAIGPSYMTPPASPAPAAPAAPAVPAIGLPTVSGPLSSPPPGTALINIRVPDTWAQVSFNGTDSVTSGKTRWFVTPRLGADGKSYTVSASWAKGGRIVRQQQVVSLQAGQTKTVIFAN
jgi:uncharacterized protein (TIGR03000 family)